MSPNDAPDPSTPDPSAASPEDARLQDLLDGRLDDGAADALRARIEAEPALRETWEELRGIQALVRSYGPQGADLDLPADFLARVKARVSEAAAPPSAGVVPSADAVPSAGPAQRGRRPRRMLRMLTVAYAAAALLVVGFTVRYVLVDTPPAADDVRTAKEQVDRKAPSEVLEIDGLKARSDAKTASPSTRERDKDSESGFAQEIEKPAGGDEPAGSLADAGMRVPEATSPEAKTGAPAPVLGGGKSDGSARGGDAGGTKVGGRYGAPGGAVQPGARPLPDTKSRGRRGGTTESARKEELAKLLSGDEGLVYVLEVDDAAQARGALAALLADESLASLDKLPRDGRTTAGKPKSTNPDATPDDATPEEAAASRRKRGPADAPAAEGASVPTGRLYRMDAAQAGRLLAALRSQPTQAPREKSEQESAADDAYAGLALLEVATPELDAAALARLDRRASSGVWGAELLARLVKKAGAGEPQAARPVPTPTTPAAPRAPTRAPAPRKPAGDAPRTDEGAEPAAESADGKPVRPAKAPLPKRARVRILVVERR